MWHGIQGTYGLKLVTGPAAEPVTVADVKARARVDVTADDDDLAALITAAREQVEAECGRALLTQTYSMFLDRFPLWRGYVYLPRPPLQAVAWIKYYDLDGVQQTFDAGLYYASGAREPGRIGLVWNQIWPFIQYGRIDGIEIRYTAGYGDTADTVPAAAKDAIRIIVADHYANRWANDRPIPPAARRLIDTLEVGHIH